MFNSVIEGLSKVVIFALNMLPPSPFKMVSDMLGSSGEFYSTLLGFFNFLFPVSECIVVLETWCFAIGVWYVWQLVFRWANVID